MRSASRGALAACLCTAALTSVGGAPSRAASAAPAPVAVDWIAGDAHLQIWSTGGILRLRVGSAPAREIPAGFVAVGGARIGDEVLLLGADGAWRLLHPESLAIDPVPGAGESPFGHPADRMAGSSLVVPGGGGAARPPFLVTAGPDGDVALIPSPVRPAHATGPARFGRIRLGSPVRALAVSDHRIYAATPRGLTILDASDPARPRRAGAIPFAEPVRAMAAAPDRIYLATTSGIVRLALPYQPGARPDPIAPHEATAILLAGRDLFAVTADGRLVRARDASPGALTHAVAVLNNFFSPEAIAIQPADTVRWTNTSGFHNVVSCAPGIFGCDDEEAAEPFTSGFPGTFWLFSHTFQAPGESRYLCQPHAPDMAGVVTVTAPPTLPAAVPDGRTGEPMTVVPIDAAGEALRIAWDATCSVNVLHHLIWGFASGWPAAPGGTFALSGEICGIAPPFLWKEVPDPSVGKPALIWWIVVSSDGEGLEGAWGRDSAGRERQGPGPDGSSGRCGVTSKAVSDACTP